MLEYRNPVLFKDKIIHRKGAKNAKVFLYLPQRRRENLKNVVCLIGSPDYVSLHPGYSATVI